MNSYLVGLSLVVISALCFSLQPLFASALYELGWVPLSVLVLRFGCSVALMAGFLLLTRRPVLALFDARALVFGLCMAGSALGYYTAGQRLGFSLAVVLLFSFPVGVTCFLALRARQMPSPLRWIALGSAVLGTYWVIGGPSGPGDWIGISAGLGAACCYGLAMIISDGRVVRDPWIDVFWVSVGASLVLMAACWAMGVTLQPSSTALLLGMGLAVSATILATGLLIAGIARIGASDASTISLSEALFSALFAVVWLGDSASSGLIGGGFLIVFGAYLLTRSPGVAR